MSRSESVKANHVFAVTSGLHPGNIPLGYMKGSGVSAPPLPNPKTAPAIVAAFELRTKGWTLDKISEGLTAFGIQSTHKKPLTRQAIKSILTNPFYKGTVRLNGKVYPGKHQAIVSEELFEAVQRTFSSTEH